MIGPGISDQKRAREVIDTRHWGWNRRKRKGSQYKYISNMIKSLPGRASYSPGFAIEAWWGRRFENEMISVQYAIGTAWYKSRASHAHDTCWSPGASVGRLEAKGSRGFS